MSTERVPSRETKQFIEIPRAEFNLVPKRRARYIVSYGIALVLLIAPRVYMLARQTHIGDVLAWVIFGGMIIAYVVFYWNFVLTLKTMAYPVLFIAFLGMAVLLPIPGLLAVAWVDKRVAKIWDAANPGPSYRKDPRQPAADES